MPTEAKSSVQHRPADRPVGILRGSEKLRVRVRELGSSRDSRPLGIRFVNERSDMGLLLAEYHLLYPSTFLSLFL